MFLLHGTGQCSVQHKEKKVEGRTLFLYYSRYQGILSRIWNGVTFTLYHLSQLSGEVTKF